MDLVTCLQGHIHIERRPGTWPPLYVLARRSMTRLHLNTELYPGRLPNQLPGRHSFFYYSHSHSHSLCFSVRTLYTLRKNVVPYYELFRTFLPTIFIPSNWVFFNQTTLSHFLFWFAEKFTRYTFDWICNTNTNTNGHKRGVTETQLWTPHR